VHRADQHIDLVALPTWRFNAFGRIRFIVRLRIFSNAPAQLAARSSMARRKPFFNGDAKKLAECAGVRQHESDPHLAAWARGWFQTATTLEAPPMMARHSR
jgi:hypothetical protein